VVATPVRRLLPEGLAMSYVKNRDALLLSGDAQLRRLILEIAEKAIAAADPARALRHLMRMDGSSLCIGEDRFELSGDRRVYVVGAGKASFPIAKVIEELVGRHICKGVVACKHGQEGQLDRMRLIHAGHPLPDAGSVLAAEEAVALMAEVRENDLVLCCFTGGSSSLFVAPAGEITLADKAATFHTLLTCGANIEEINDVRKHLSRVKGGRLIKTLPPGATVVNMTVSDVIGDALDYITDPTVPDRSTFRDAQDVLDKYSLWARLPEAVTSHLRQAATRHETIRADELSHLRVRTFLLARTDAACAGAEVAAGDAGIRSVLLSTLFEGESSALGRNLAAIARQIRLDGRPVAPPVILIGGGETVVTFGDAAGLGGPNQEFAVAAALEISGTPGIVVLGLDTDGTDGPTEYAGAIVDGSTASVADAAGIDLYASLARHDVTPALEAISHAVKTGPTGTNVNDLKLILVGPTEPAA